MADDWQMVNVLSRVPSTMPARFTSDGFVIERPAVGFREPAYAVLSALFGMVALILALLTFLRLRQSAAR